MTLESSLLSYYSNSGPERGGIITRMGPVECQNSSEKPNKHFEFSFEDLIKLDEPETLGTFHTHPDGSSNLSYEDYESFSGYPSLTHYIIGKNGVKAFKFVDGRLLDVS